MSVKITTNPASGATVVTDLSHTFKLTVTVDESADVFNPTVQPAGGPTMITLPVGPAAAHPGAGGTFTFTLGPVPSPGPYTVTVTASNSNGTTVVIITLNIVFPEFLSPEDRDQLIGGSTSWA
jgi:hypothetical protein